MAEIILAVLCIVIGVACAALALLSAWAGALKQAATGSSDGISGVWFALVAVAGIGGGILILVL